MSSCSDCQVKYATDITMWHFITLHFKPKHQFEVDNKRSTLYKKKTTGLQTTLT